MLPENLKEHAVAASVEAFDADALRGGAYEFGELTLEIAPAKIVSVCGFLKYDQQFIRLSSVTAVDRFPAGPRFEVVYHLHSVQHKQRLRVKCRIPGPNPEIDSVWNEIEIEPGIPFVITTLSADFSQLRNRNCSLLTFT